MENRPELYWHLLGLMKLGVVPSLVNSHGVGKPLAHAIRVCAPRRIVVGSEVLGPFAEIRGELGDGAAVDVDLDAGATAPAGYSLWSRPTAERPEPATRSRPPPRRWGTSPRISTRAAPPGPPRRRS